MSILNDVRDLRRDPDDPEGVAECIRLLANDVPSRLELVHQWEYATGRAFPKDLERTLTGAIDEVPE